MITLSKEMADTEASAILAENVTPKRRVGRPRKNKLPATPSSPSCPNNVQENLTSNVLPIQKHEETIAIEDCTTLLDKVTPRRRGRPKKDALPPTPSSPCPSNMGESDLSAIQSSRKSQSRRTSQLVISFDDDVAEKNVDTPFTSGRGRKRKASIPLEDEAKTKTASVKVKLMANVTCGVCKKEMPEPNFTYHRYSVHYGLARPEGASQVFTELEKAQELKKTLEKIKRLSCSKCTASFTTLLGFQYHQKRCGVDAADIQNMQHECNICGKRVMALAAHMKIHEKRIEKVPSADIVASTPSPATKSKRVAAQKAASLLREIKEDIADVPTHNPPIKAAKFFTEPSSNKVTNSIILAWKKQIEKKSTADCRYPSCPFSSDCIDKLKEHHPLCEIGLKSKAFACLKCTFSAPDRSSITEHVLNTHVSEKDAAFELSDGSSNDDDTDEETKDDEECDSDADRKKFIPQNTKTLDKAYGLSSNVLQQFKTLSTSHLIPMWLAKYHKIHFARNASLYKDWTPKIKNVVYPPSNYFPAVEESVPFAHRVGTTAKSSTETSVIFERLRKFQARLQNGRPIFFCGGSIQCASWCPMPPVVDESSSFERDQYLALSTFHEEHRKRSASEAAFASEYLIQIWNCGKLRNLVPAETAPKLVIGIAHGYGRIWSLVWCPSGCYEYERLGLLAAACSDGTVRLFSVPNATTLSQEESKPIYLRVDACVTLRLNTKETSECTSLDWDSTLGHKFIVAGFASGIVALWDLQTKSPLLLKDNIIFPTWSFYAHSSVVSGVSLSPHHTDARFIATASTDRTVKLWDRQDLALPVSWSKRSRVTDIRWRRHWPGIIVSVEDVYSMFRTASMFYDFGYTGNRQPLLPQNSVVWSTAENEYLDVIAHSTDAGEVVVYASHLAVIDCDDKKLRKQRILLLQTDLVDTSKGGAVSLNRMQKIYMETPKKTDAKTEMRDNPRYSLVFNDMTTSVVRTGLQPVNNAACETMDILRPCDEPLTSINKISFNPNFESHTWMCVCGESGLVQLLRVDSPSTSKVANCYVKEMNSSNIDN